MKSLQRLACITLLIALPCAAQTHQKPTPAAATWWAYTTALANDSMQGRDTGTAAYQRAADYVAHQFAAFGLQPAGEPLTNPAKPTYFQSVPMHQVALLTEKSSVELLPDSNPTQSTPIQFLQQITLVPRDGLPALTTAPLVFLGYGLPDSITDLHGKIAVFFSNSPASLAPADRLSFAARRMAALSKSGAIALLAIDNPAAIETFHWPAAYARTVTLASTPAPPPNAPILLRISAQAAPLLFSACGHSFADILTLGTTGQPLATFSMQAALHLHLTTETKDISSPNILAILPGSDPSLAPQYVALSAHLDGYGFGTPVLGDSLYNGALDDAAYVSTLLELAQTQAALPLKSRPRRSLLFCIFTGEEKGLLGSAYFTAHPTVPAKNIVADLNLDQLRPIFPLHILTMEGLDDSTLGSTVRTLASTFHIEVRPDLEPERQLYRRADNYNFVRIGVPIASFIFGYNPGSPEEVVYRDWYNRRYHKPQDDLDTPIVWDAAVTFNRFYSALATAIANNPTRPAWLTSSPNAPK